MTPREILELCERLLLRRRFPVGAIPAAASMVLAAECADGGGLRLVRRFHDRLDPGAWQGIRILDGDTPVVDAGGASALIVGPALPELAATVAGRVQVVRPGQPELLDMLPAYARCRAPVSWVSVIRDGECAVVQVDGPAPPLRPPPGLVVDGRTWRELMSYANDVLAPASAGSRGDAG